MNKNIIELTNKSIYNKYKKDLILLYQTAFSTPPFDLPVDYSTVFNFFEEQFLYGKIFIYFKDNKMIGFVTIEPVARFDGYQNFINDSNAFYVSAIAVDSNNQLKGIGDSLIKKVFDIYSDCNILIRTRADTDGIHRTLLRNQAEKTHTYSLEIKNKIVPLFIWLKKSK